MLFKDHFTVSAAEYSRFRPLYPEDLFRFLASICPNRNTAWDCATGSGQAAAGISPFFERVIATDASEKQIRNARAYPRVDYYVTLAERPALRDASVDLAMAAQAAHWFDLGCFYTELRRIVRPGGVIAVWFYSLPRIHPILDDMVRKLYAEILGSYWPPERKLIDDKIDSIDFPFRRMETPVFQMNAFWDLDHLTGYVSTWSAVNRYKAANGTDPMSMIYPELSAAWGDPADSKRVVWPIHIRVGQV